MNFETAATHAVVIVSRRGRYLADAVRTQTEPVIVRGLSLTVAAMLLPWLLNSLKLDPALGSGPMATVVQDLLSIWTYLLVGYSVFTL